MTNEELKKLLQANRTPVMPGEYWAEFPERATRQIRQREGNSITTTHRHEEQRWAVALQLLRRKPALIFAFVIFSALLGFTVWQKQQKSSAERMQLAEAAKYFREIETLFPNQLQGIVFDASGPRMILADRPSVAASPALYLKLCSARGCKRYITFSGQRIRFNDQEFEVLSSRRGEVLLVGERTVWSSATSPIKGATLRIEAHSLQTAS